MWRAITQQGAHLVYLLVAIQLQCCAQYIKTTEDGKFLGSGTVPAPVERFRGHVSVRNDAHHHTCNGVLIHPGYVLTAAHCIAGRNPLVYINARNSTCQKCGADTEVMRAVQVFKYSQWAGNFDEGYDIAILKLPRNVAGVAIPTIAAHGEHLQAPTTGVVMVGFDASPSDLKMTELEIGTNFIHDFEWPPQVICAYTVPNGTHISEGCSGSPVFQLDCPGMDSDMLSEGNASLDKLVGILSAVYVSNSLEVVLFTNISFFQPWIEEVTNPELPQCFTKRSSFMDILEIATILLVWSQFVFSIIIRLRRIFLKAVQNWLIRCGNISYNHGDFNQASRFYWLAWFLCKRLYGEGNAHTLTCLMSLGRASRQGGKHWCALACHIAVWKNIEKFGPNSRAAVRACVNLGNAYLSLGLAREAQPHFRNALDNAQRHFPNSECVALSLNSLGTFYYEMRGYEQARYYFKSAYDRRKNSLGEEDKRTLASLYDLAKALRQLGMCNEAEDLHNSVYKSRLRVLHMTHPDTLKSLVCCANVCLSLGEYKEALKLHEEALHGWIGRSRRDTATSYNSLGNVHMAMARKTQDISACQKHLQKAEENIQQALNMRLECLGPRHLDSAYSMRDLGDVLRMQGKTGQAAQHFRKALEWALNVLDDEKHSLIIDLQKEVDKCEAE